MQQSHKIHTAERRSPTLGRLLCFYKPEGQENFKKQLPEPRFPCWDLWIVVTLLNEFNGDWNSMLDHFRAERKSLYHSDVVEGLLNYIRTLHQTLAQAGLTAEDLVAGADPEFLKKQKRKILEIGISGASGVRERSRAHYACRGRTGALGVGQTRSLATRGAASRRWGGVNGNVWIVHRLFSRRFDAVRRKYVVVVIVSDVVPGDRHWIITAYIARRLVKGEIEWQRD